MNHILFADEVMIFSKANSHFVQKVESVLTTFARAFGFHPNMSKSKIVFSKGVKRRVRKFSNFKEGVLPVKYLGFPLHSKKLINYNYQPVVDKIRKIGFYGLNTLSQAERVELIRTVVMPPFFGCRYSNSQHELSSKWRVYQEFSLEGGARPIINFPSALVYCLRVKTKWRFGA